VGHSYALPVIKLLFATARTCAYPDCTIPLVFIDEDRDVREIAVQIAHIRSPKPDGPRHDPDFPHDKLNSDVNLLLLCGVHHHPVDRNGSKYSTEELLAWKRAQTAEGGGFTVQDDDIMGIAAKLESSLDELVKATRLQTEVAQKQLAIDRDRHHHELEQRHEDAAPALEGHVVKIDGNDGSGHARLEIRVTNSVRLTTVTLILPASAPVSLNRRMPMMEQWVQFPEAGSGQIEVGRPAHWNVDLTGRPQPFEVLAIAHADYGMKWDRLLVRVVFDD
jgi:hypothetical protein